MTETYPYSYHAYGLNVLSQIPIIGFFPTKFENFDVIVKTGVVPMNLETIINHNSFYQSNENEFLLRLDTIANYYIKNGNEITVQKLNNSMNNGVSAFITGTSFGAILNQRKMLPLHASTVIFKNKCLVFAGVSGSGKTTIAATLIKLGGILVADDISVIDFSFAKPAVYPAFPCIKIWEDSLNHIGLQSKDLEIVRSELHKYYLPIKSFRQDLAEIDCLYVLNIHKDSEFQLEKLNGVEKFRMLKKHTYFSREIQNTSLEINHFKLINRLAALVPVSVINRPIGEIRTETILRIICDL